MRTRFTAVVHGRHALPLEHRRDHRLQPPAREALCQAIGLPFRTRLKLFRFGERLTDF